LDDVYDTYNVIDFNLGEFGEYSQETAGTHCAHSKMMYLMAQRARRDQVVGIVVVVIVVNVMTLLVLRRAPTAKTAGKVVPPKYGDANFGESQIRIAYMLIILPPEFTLNAKHGLIALAPQIFGKLAKKGRVQLGAGLWLLVMDSVLS
jgi:hypothetical protein